MAIQHYHYIEAISEAAELDVDELVTLRDVREHLFWLGLISLQYNALVQAFKYIVEAYVDFTVANLLFDKTSNEPRR